MPWLRGHQSGKARLHASVLVNAKTRSLRNPVCAFRGPCNPDEVGACRGGSKPLGSGSPNSLVLGVALSSSALDSRQGTVVRPALPMSLIPLSLLAPTLRERRSRP